MKSPRITYIHCHSPPGPSRQGLRARGPFRAGCPFRQVHAGRSPGRARLAPALAACILDRLPIWAGRAIGALGGVAPAPARAVTAVAAPCHMCINGKHVFIMMYMYESICKGEGAGGYMKKKLDEKFSPLNCAYALGFACGRAWICERACRSGRWKGIGKVAGDLALSAVGGWVYSAHERARAPPTPDSQRAHVRRCRQAGR